MNKFIIIALVLVISTTEAQIFKCETNKGKVVYQDTECEKSHKQNKVVVQEFDPNRILDAQKKLNMELQFLKESQAIRDEQTLNERKIIAIEDQIRSNEELTNAALENANAIERNTKAVKRRNPRNNLYYFSPPIHRARHHTKPNKNKPVTKQFEHKKAVKSSISFNLEKSVEH